jgi:hypothetical protein
MAAKRRRARVEKTPAGRAAPETGVPAAGIAAGDDPPDKPIDQPERGPATPNAEPPQRVRVEEDTLIERPDLDSAGGGPPPHLGGGRRADPARAGGLPAQPGLGVTGVRHGEAVPG